MKEQGQIIPWQAESSTWQAAYLAPEQRQRRRREMLTKLERLGILAADWNARVLDLCCGAGEALETLHDVGFRDLHGIDFISLSDWERLPAISFQQGDVRALPIADDSVDWILNIHSLHHLQDPDNVALFLNECFRMLKPGGHLGIIDFPSTPIINVAFRLFLVKPLLITPYLRWFGEIIQSEWHFLEGYLARWKETRRLLHAGRFRVVTHERHIFYYYLTLAKSESAG